MNCHKTYLSMIPGMEFPLNKFLPIFLKIGGKFPQNFLQWGFAPKAWAVSVPGISQLASTAAGPHDDLIPDLNTGHELWATEAARE